MRAGLAVVPVSNKLPAEVLSHLIEDCAAALVLSNGTGALPAKAVGGVDVVPFGDLASNGGHAFGSWIKPQDFESIAPAEGELAEILYPSGSTGMPKGVALDHAGQLSALSLLEFENDGSPSQQILAQPLFHMNGIVTQCLALKAGDTTYLQPRFRASDYTAAIDTFKVEKVNAVPTMWARTLRLVEEGHASLG